MAFLCRSFNPSFNFLFSLGFLLHLSVSLLVCLSLHIVLANKLHHNWFLSQHVFIQLYIIIIVFIF